MNLIYINKNQFGYHTDAFMHCKYAKADFNITFICFDSGYKKVEEKGINVVYVKDRKNKAINGVAFISTCFIYLAFLRGIVFIQYFPNCSLFKRIFFWKKMILDIRSLSISHDEESNEKSNERIRKDSIFFDHITVITESVRSELRIPTTKSTLLPIGTDILSKVNKNFSLDIELLYIGTLTNRNIYQTILGLGLFLNKFPGVKVIYFIVGDGEKADLDKIYSAINEFKLQNIVHILGRKRHHEIQHLWDSCQIGISFVPITKAYHLQPPTKTLEYMSAGMAVLGTETQENANSIDNDSGILFLDNANSFAESLEKFYLKKDKYNSTIIRGKVENYSWQKIVESVFLKVLKN